MRKSKFTEAQIITMLKEHESGMKTSDICRQQGISQATFFKWKSKYSGLDASDLKRIRELEEENNRLKRMYAELSQDVYILNDIITKKGWGPVNKKRS
jgi:putative transposase